MMLHINTPLLYSPHLHSVTDRRVWLKMDALQPSGSFKIRGIGHACEYYARNGARRFISSSGGNAGMAVAYAGKMLSIPVLVIVPETTSAQARENIQRLGAQVQVSGVSWKEANEFALRCVESTDAFIHPFDNPLLWEGHASLIDEVVAARTPFDAVVCSVGGGGLYAGIVEGLRRNKRESTPVIAVETHGADSFSRAILADKRIELEAITSIASSLGAKQVSEQAFRLAREHPTVSLVVKDEEAVIACRKFLNDHRLLVEPACGASLAALYLNHQAVQQFENLMVVVCGGTGITTEQLAAL